MANEERLIDTETVIRKLRKANCAECDNYNAIRCRACWVDDVVSLLDDSPTVDAVEVVHGHWYEHHGITICSHCQAMFDTDLTMLQIPSTWKMPNYCPNCGAKMDGERKDNDND